jgi:multidrug efflux pump subunit AcrB
MKGITAFSLNNSRTVIMTLVVVIVGGIYSFVKLPKLEDPYITIREAVVVATFPGDYPAHRRGNPEHGRGG